MRAMAQRLTFTAIYEPVEDGWIQARIQELPAVITAAPNLEAAKELLVDAVREYLLSLGGPAGERRAGAEAARSQLEIVIEAA